MGERMMIQYSVEADELKNEVKRLLATALKRLMSIKADTPATRDILTIGTLKEISALREELARIDIMFEDVSAIIDGYVRYEHNSFVDERSPRGDTQDVPSIQKLQEKIKDLQVNMREIDEDSN